ncbi:MAG: AAA family ATPase [Thermodesulfobacteriota bacterium]|nr:AAA family ATPase [Thermodesulfobacteriota bacterium]
MRIKALSIRGFKTFYERSLVEFDSEISAIVGPNGCGKTNILDAFRWVLGEQNPRILRSDSMAQIISDGNDNLSKQGFAEVSLLIEEDNNDFVETEIKRKLFRNGESEYLINNQVCRLKDIKDIVLSFGAGSKSFTMIPQGQIETYITSKPEEKRQLIDEAAGLAKYKVRRAETERKILLIKDNVEKTRYVQSEVKEQKEVLAEQASKAEEYSDLVQEYKNLEAIFYKSRYKDLNGKLTLAQADKDLFQKSFDEIESQKNNLKHKIKEIASNKNKINEKLEEFNNKMLMNKEGELKLISSRDILTIETKLLIEELERCKNEKNEINIEMDSLGQEIRDLEKNYHAADNGLSVKNQLELENIKRKCIISKQEETDKLKKIQEDLQVANKKFAELNAEIKVTESRMKFLENVESSYGWLPEGIRSFVQNLKGRDIDGILSDYIKPNDGYKKAVESALGEKLKWILINDKRDAVSTIEEFKRNCDGKGTFISLGYTKIAGANTSLDYKQIMDCIDCHTENRPFLASIFGDTYVVETIKDALNARDENPGCNFVTKDGEFFDANGSITVGSAPDSILQIKEEIKELMTQKDSYDKEIDLITLDIKKTEEEIFDINNRIASFNNEIDTTTKYQSSGIGKINDKIKKINEKANLTTSRMSELEDKIETNKKNLSELDRQLPDMNSERDIISNEIIELNTRIKINNSEIETLNNKILEKDEIVDQKRSESLEYEARIQKIKLEIDQLIESVNDKNIDISRISSDEEDKIETLRKEGSLSKARFNRLQKAIEEFGPVNLLAPDEYKKLQEKYDFIDSQLLDLDSSLINLEKTIKKIDEESRTAFIDAFDKISAKYNESVKRLFGGGEGKLVLTNPDSIEHSGIEVMLKIGLKKYRTLKSYSGGERALAGIALLLSAYFVKPAPFLLLDEVDAPLDDRNISKFGEILQEISQKSQIAIITHNKGTMKYCKKLIGVTSKLEGISEIVPVELS